MAALRTKTSSPDDVYKCVVEQGDEQTAIKQTPRNDTNPSGGSLLITTNGKYNPYVSKYLFRKI